MVFRIGRQILGDFIAESDHHSMAMV